jgi:flagellar protein FliS
MGRRYQEMEILSATPEGLVVLLYEGALRQLASACEHGREKRAAERGGALLRAHAIVTELRHALDHERGGEIARNLDALYEFAIDRIIEAHLRGADEPIEDARRLLAELHGAWAQIAKTAPREDAA